LLSSRGGLVAEQGGPYGNLGMASLLFLHGAIARHYA